jgi:uncharacterized protein DUF4349
MRHSAMTTLRRGLAGTALVALALTATACSGGGTESSSGDAATSYDSGGGAEAPADAVAPFTGGDTASGVNRTVVRVRSVIMTGEVAVTDDDLDGARKELDDVLTALDGSIDSEQTQNDDEGTIERSTIVVRVPVDRFPAAMTALQGLGTLQHSDRSSKNVTTEVIDVDERVETLENSLDRLQDYQDEAKDIDDLIRYEREITQRQAELQSLKAQQSYLADQTAMSTITLYLSTPDKYVAPPGALDDAGFVAGLKSGWNALQDTVVVVLTVVGAVLPFALVLGLVGVPLWVLLRRTLRARAASPADTPPAS